MSEERKLWKVGTLTYSATGLVVLFAWLLVGDFAWSIRDRSVSPMSQWYLSHLGISNVLFAFIISSFPAAVGLIVGPIISVKSDRHRGPHGRRIPFLLITTPLAALGMIGLSLTPLLAGWLHRLMPAQSPVAIALVCFALFWTVFEFSSIAGQAVLGGLINDVVPHSLLGRFYGLFRAVSLIDGMIFNFWIMGLVPTHFTMILFIIGTFYGAAFLLVCLKIKEGNYPPPEPLPPNKNLALGAFDEIRRYCRECFTNSYYIWIFVLLMMASLAFSPVNIFCIAYANSLGMTMDANGKALALTYAISFCLSFFLGWLVDLFHPLRMVMLSLFGYLVVAVWAWVYATTPSLFFVAWVLHGVLSGCYFTTAASLGQRLFPPSRFAQFASASQIFISLAGVLIGPLVGLLIDGSSGGFHHTFAVGGFCSLVGLFAAWQVYLRFLRLGGPANYSAPE